MQSCAYSLLRRHSHTLCGLASQCRRQELAIAVPGIGHAKQRGREADLQGTR